MEKNDGKRGVLGSSFAESAVPARRICSAAEMLADPQLLAREMFLNAKRPGGRLFKLPGIAPKLSETPGSTQWIGPELGEYTNGLLAGLGYD